MKKFSFLRRIASSSSGLKLSAIAKNSSLVAVVVCGALAALTPTLARANQAYANLAGGNLNFSLTATTAGLITKNDDWSGVASVEGYCGNLAPTTFGVDPQTILTTDFNAPSYNYPTGGTGTCVAANKGNPSAFNVGGLAEFDSGTYLAIGFQGNVQSRSPQMVFYVNTTGRSNLSFKYEATDLDSGNNDAVSQVALQYRIGETGNFINLPAGYIADATVKNSAGLKTTRLVSLPAAINNQPKVQFRLISTDAAAPDGTSTPDEWVGINNIAIGNLAPTAATVNAGGHLTSSLGRGIRNAIVTMTDASGNVRTTFSGAGGYYNFDNVQAGETYIFNARGKRFNFSQPTQLFNISEDTDNIDFVAYPGELESSRHFISEVTAPLGDRAKLQISLQK